MRDSKPRSKVKAVLPVDFSEEHKIPTREYEDFTQWNASKINEALREYRVDDTYAILAIMSKNDMYVCDDEEVLAKSQYTYGLTEPEHSTAVISLIRRQLVEANEHED